MKKKHRKYTEEFRIVGDGEGVVPIPAQVAESVAHDGYEQELRELFFAETVADGAPILGVYPPNEETLAEYEQWLAARVGVIK